MSSEVMRRPLSVPSQHGDDLNIASLGSDINRTSLSVAPASFGALNASFLLGGDLVDNKSDDDNSCESGLQDVDSPITLGNWRADTSRDQIVVPQPTSPTSLFSFSFASFASSYSSSSSSSSSVLSPTTPAPRITTSKSRAAPQHELSSTVVENLILNSLADRPPALDAHGWHPLSGSPAARQAAVHAFGLGEQLASSSLSDRQRWYAGVGSPWKCALGPPHGGVAFGVPYGGAASLGTAGAKPHPGGSENSNASNISHLYEGRWRITETEVFDRPEGKLGHSTSSALASSLYLSKPTWLFSPNGTICEERVKLPLIGQIASTHWLVCVYVSPTVRLLRCIRGRPSTSGTTSTNKEASSSGADNDDPSLAFTYALATLQSLTVRDATTGAEVTGSTQGIDRWIGKGELKPPRRPHSPPNIVDSGDKHTDRKSQPNIGAVVAEPNVVRQQVAAVPRPPPSLGSSPLIGSDTWQSRKPQPPPYSPSSATAEVQEPRLSLFCVPVSPRTSPMPSNTPAPGGAAHAAIMAVGAGGGKRRLRIELRSISGGRTAQVLDHAPPKPRTRSFNHNRGDLTSGSGVSTVTLADGESWCSPLTPGDSSLRGTLSETAAEIPIDTAKPPAMPSADTPAMALSPVPSDTAATESDLKALYVLDAQDPTNVRTSTSIVAANALKFPWEASLASAINRQVILLESGTTHSEGASGNRNSILDRDSNSMSNSDTVDRASCGPIVESHLPLCAGCDSRIHLRSLEALGALWHNSCLICVHCAKPLGAGERFYVDNDVARDSIAGSTAAATAMRRSSSSIHCVDCYFEVTYTRCFRCLAHIVNEPALAAMDQTFHLRCFSCAACGQNLGVEVDNSTDSNAKNRGLANIDNAPATSGNASQRVGYFEHNGQVYCDHDFQCLFGSTCSGCGLSLAMMPEATHQSFDDDDVNNSASNIVEVLKALWHRECFVCAECSTLLNADCSPSAAPPTSSWGTVSGVMYCPEHFARRFALESEVLDELEKVGANETRTQSWTAGGGEVRSSSLYRSLSRMPFSSSRLTLQEEPVRLSFNGGSLTPPVASTEESSAALPTVPSLGTRGRKHSVVIPPSQLSNNSDNADNAMRNSSNSGFGKVDGITNEGSSRTARSPTLEQTISELKHDWFLPTDAPGSNMHERLSASTSVGSSISASSPSSAQKTSSPPSIKPLYSSAQGTSGGSSISKEKMGREIIGVRHELLSAGIDWARESQDRGAQRAQYSWKQTKHEASAPVANLGIDAVPRTQDLEQLPEPSQSAQLSPPKSLLQQGQSTMDVAVTLRYGVAASLGQSVPHKELEPRLFVLRSATSSPADDLSTIKEPGAAGHGLKGLEPTDYNEVTTYVLGTSPSASPGTDVVDCPVKSAANLDAVQNNQDLLHVEEAPLSFEALAPAVFKALRQQVFGMGDAEYFASMCQSPSTGASTGSGKSGSYFMYSADRRLIIKSVKRSEFPFLMRILPSYVRHMETNHFHSLLPRYLGLYKIKQPDQPAERLLVMNNILHVPPEALPKIPYPSRAPSEVAVMNKELEENDAEVKALQRAELDGLLRQANKRELSERDADRLKALMRVVAPSSTQRYVSFRDVAAEASKKMNDSKERVALPEVQSNAPCADTENELHVGNARHFTAAPPGFLNDVYFARTYDLKGSLLKRFVTDDDVARGETVYKDLNFCRCHDGTDNKGNAVPRAGKRCRKLHIGPERWPSFVASFLADVAWLRAHNIMDYSLLVGCALVNEERNKAAPAPTLSTAAGYVSQEAPSFASAPMATSTSNELSPNQSLSHSPPADVAYAISKNNSSDQLRYRVAADDLGVIEDVPSNSLRPFDHGDSRNQDRSDGDGSDNNLRLSNQRRWTVGQRVIVDINGASCAATIKAVRTCKLSSKGQVPPPLPPRRPRPQSRPQGSPLASSHSASSDVSGSTTTTGPAHGRVESAPQQAAPEEARWSHLTPSCYSEWVRDRGGLRARSVDEQEKNVVYYMGIIDILQEFNMTKRLESVYKQRLQTMAGKDPTLISAVDASVYSKRFVDFITNHME